ncbi:MAG: hypothetical protein JKY88_16485 [Pseudomonadales bacterium]|nr:hypothetical protein [Pseudomonadales bacterium]
MREILSDADSLISEMVERLEAGSDLLVRFRVIPFQTEVYDGYLCAFHSDDEILILKEEIGTVGEALARFGELWDRANETIEDYKNQHAYDVWKGK